MKEARRLLDVRSCTFKVGGKPPRPLEPDSKAARRFAAAAERRGHKVYVVKDGREFCYIGMTRQALSDRMNQGFYGKGKRKYLYMWRHLAKVDIYIWRAGRPWWRLIETIEAELAFFVRRDTDRWPEHQVEIHFHNPNPDLASGARNQAELLYSQLGGGRAVCREGADISEVSGHHPQTAAPEAGTVPGTEGTGNRAREPDRACAGAPGSEDAGVPEGHRFKREPGRRPAVNVVDSSAGLARPADRIAGRDTSPDQSPMGR